MNTLDFKKANVKHTENCHSINKKPIVVSFQPPPLRDYPEEQFTELWIAALKGSFGDTCRLALNRNSWFVLERHSTQGRSGHRPHVTSVKVLTHTEEETKKKKVALVTFAPPADKWCQFLLTLGTKNRIWSVLERCPKTGLGRDITQIFTRPRLCSLFNKIYSISLSSYTEISIYECL